MMNIEKISNCKNTDIQPSNQKNTSQETNFSDELKNLKQESSKTEDKENKSTKDEISEEPNVDTNENSPQENLEIGNAIDGLHGIFDEINKFNRTNENDEILLKQNVFYDDEKHKHEELGLIDNNMNIQEPKEKINLQMGGNMNFTGDGQPFAEFVNPEKTKNILETSAKELEEENAILSTMEENVAIANKNMAISKTRIVENEHGVQKVNKNNNIVVDTIVSYDSVVMDKSDVDFFVNLAEKGEINLNETQQSSKSANVSKTLADLLAKSMQDNKPVRIDFDNDISVIIKVSRNGKISADFLPSSQIAEAYLRENLPLLRQKFDDNNIEYDELNNRKQKQDDQENKKKGRKDE